METHFYWIYIFLALNLLTLTSGMECYVCGLSCDVKEGEKAEEVFKKVSCSGDGAKCTKSTKDGKAISRGCAPEGATVEDGTCVAGVCVYVCNADLCNGANGKTISIWIVIVCFIAHFLRWHSLNQVS